MILKVYSHAEKWVFEKHELFEKNKIRDFQ